MNTNGSIEKQQSGRQTASRRGNAAAGAVLEGPDYDRRLISWAIFASCTRIFSSSA